MKERELPVRERARNVTAVLGPTNTGKTHLAIERMLGHDTGMIGLPLRLLAREVYNRVVERVGPEQVALITGEEKIKPPGTRYWIATLEAMPRDLEVSFVAIDEIQLAADFDRGHVFTDRLLHMRGRGETLVIGAGTMRPLVEMLLPGVSIVSRPRLSKLTFSGEKKITRLPRRSVIVAFSVEEVYAIAELIRRQNGGAAVVLGALSPRTRNAQVALYQSGDVEYLVATDAIGMGLNLDVDHVAFAADRKFDGFGFRRLNPAEFGQIAGRAGRYMRDGTFGTTGRCPAFDADLVELMEEHDFEPVRVLQWRNSALDFSSIEALLDALAKTPVEQGLTRAPPAADLLALEALARDAQVRSHARDRAGTRHLWEVCQVPDYRKVSPTAHAELIATLFLALRNHGHVSDDWMAGQLKLVDRTEGDIDTLSARIAQVRTWTFVANRPDWLRDPEHWQGVTRRVEDRLSDALHERLAQRFVDRRTSVLMRRLRENAMLEAEVTPAGDVLVESQHIGHLHGFQFAPDPLANGPEAKALRAAAMKALVGEIETRAARLSGAPDEAIVLASDGSLRWLGEVVAKLSPGEKVLTPLVRLLADEHLTGPVRDSVQARLDLWVKSHIEKLLGPLNQLEAGEGLSGIARGVAFQVGEALGVLERSRVAEEVKSLDQEARAALRKLGLRFGAYHLYLPALLKPAPRGLATQLWALKHGGFDVKGIGELAHLASSGRTSIAVDKEIPKGLYRAAGFRVCGERAVRVDILERLADLIRPAIAYRPGSTVGDPPAGAADGDGFVVTVAMTSLAGCSGEDFSSILRSLGYVVERRPGPAITAPILPAPAPASTQPIQPAAASEAVEATVPVSDEMAVGLEAAVTVPEGASPADVAPEQAVSAEASSEAVPSESQAETAPVPETPADETTTPEAAAGETVASAPVHETAEAEASSPAGGEAIVAEPEPPAEPVLIEVWRAGRHQRDSSHHRGERRDQARGPHRGRNGARQEGQQAPGEPSRERKDGERRFQARPQADGRPARKPDENGARGPGQGRPERNSGERQQGRPQRHADRPPRRDDRRPEDRRRDDRRDQDKPFWQDRPASRDRGPDPNSPFAALAALKDKLGKKE